MSSNLFEAFNNGSLRLPTTTVKFSGIPWSKHPTFEGVELKHIVTAKDTNGEFSHHLVRIAPNKSIKETLINSAFLVQADSNFWYNRAIKKIGAVPHESVDNK